VVNNAAIVESGYKVLRGELGAPSNSGLCLMLTRLIVENAFGLPSHGWYKWRTHVVERAPGDDNDPWARDMERSMREGDFGVLTPPDGSRYVTGAQLAAVAEPGDLLFRWDVARTRAGTFIGHVGVLMDGQMVLENINPASRPGSFQLGSTALTPLSMFPVTLVARFAPE
jgi:hypothetical protein